jgi:hypothetical protein
MKPSKGKSLKSGAHNTNSKTGATQIKPTNSSSRKNSTYVRPQPK